MPLYMRLPKRGFNKPNRSHYAEVNVGALQKAIDSGALDAKGKIDAAALAAAGVIRRALDGVRLLGSGELKAKLDLEVDYATAGAKAAVEKAGGTIVMTRPERAETPAPAPEPEKKAGKKKKAAAEE
jgi:large subunit ribosomal protein L15